VEKPTLLPLERPPYDPPAWAEAKVHPDQWWRWIARDSLRPTWVRRLRVSVKPSNEPVAVCSSSTKPTHSWEPVPSPTPTVPKPWKLTHHRSGRRTRRSARAAPLTRPSRMR
jgi:hypothetical protein